MKASSSTIISYLYIVEAYSFYNGDIWQGPFQDVIGFGGQGLAAHTQSSIASSMMEAVVIGLADKATYTGIYKAI
jgi:hypothetical protein